MTILVVTAVDAERDAVVHDLGVPEPVELAGLEGVSVDTPAGPLHALSCGIGPVAAAAVTARLLASAPYRLVLSAGIAGGFRDRVAVGAVVVADRVTFADLGVRTDDGFLTPLEIGLPQETSYAIADDDVVGTLRRTAIDVTTGEILTLACMTGTHAEAATLARQYPNAVAEAMEGFGVVDAAKRTPGFSGPVSEIRAISNFIGRRDPSLWDIPRALDALAKACAAVVKEPLREA